MVVGFSVDAQQAAESDAAAAANRAAASAMGPVKSEAAETAAATFDEWHARQLAWKMERYVRDKEEQTEAYKLNKKA